MTVCVESGNPRDNAKTAFSGATATVVENANMASFVFGCQGFRRGLLLRGGLIGVFAGMEDS